MARRPDPAGRPQPATARPAGHRRVAGTTSWPGSASTSATTCSPSRDDVTALDPDVVIVATGGLPQLPELEAGADRLVTSWDVLGGDVTPTGDVLFYDDNGTHSAMSAAEMIARSGARLEIVTPERMLGIDVGGMNHVPYARAFNETDTRITLNQRVSGRCALEAGRLCVEIGSDHSAHRRRAPRRLRSSSTTGRRRRPSSTWSCSRDRRNLGAVDHAALLQGRPQTLVTQPRRACSSCSASATPSPAATSTPPSTTPCGCSRTSSGRCREL